MVRWVRGRCSQVCPWVLSLLPHHGRVCVSFASKRTGVRRQPFYNRKLSTIIPRSCCAVFGFVAARHRRRLSLCRGHEQKKILRAARIHAGILGEQFGSRYEQDALEPWQQRVLMELKLDGPEQDLTVHLGGDSTNGRLPVRRAGVLPMRLPLDGTFSVRLLSEQ